jgi:hypothetical protein
MQTRAKTGVTSAGSSRKSGIPKRKIISSGKKVRLVTTYFPNPKSLISSSVINRDLFASYFLEVYEGIAILCSSEWHHHFNLEKSIEDK